MKPFTFHLLLLTQRVDEALRLERLRASPNSHNLVSLRRRKARLTRRLARSSGLAALAGS